MTPLALSAVFLAALGCSDVQSFECIFEYEVRPLQAAADLSIATGDSLALVALRVPGCGGAWPVEWSVNPTNVATIRATTDSTAMLRATAVGHVTVDARNGSRDGFTLVTVTAP